jgi:acetyltransferase-like isoleucine patch superfamily enzyme
MGNVIKWLFNLILTPVSYILQPRLVKVYVQTKNIIATKFWVRQLKRGGKNIKLQCPISIHGPEHITIGNGFTAGSNLLIEAFKEHHTLKDVNYYTPAIDIGDNVSFYHYVHIGCVNCVSIGNNVMLAGKVFITDHFHGEISIEAIKEAPNRRKVISKGPVIIEDNVWVGEGVAIMPNVTIGKNSIIGANAVVTSDIPPDCVAAGVPAKVIRKLV